MSKSIVFNEIKDQIAAEAPEFRKFGLWNNQFDNIDDENAFHFPAVFLEFSDLEFVNRSAGIQEMQGLITFHIGQEELDDKSIAILDLVDVVAKALNGFMTDTILVPLLRVNERQDPDHDQLIVWEMDFQLKAQDCTSSKYNDAVTIPGNTIDLDMPVVEEGDGISLFIKNDIIRTSNNFVEDPPVGYDPLEDTQLPMLYEFDGMVIGMDNAFGIVDGFGFASNFKNLKGTAAFDLTSTVTVFQPFLDSGSLQFDPTNDFMQTADLPASIKAGGDFTFAVIGEVIDGSMPTNQVVFQGGNAEYAFTVHSTIDEKTILSARDGGTTDALTENTPKVAGSTFIDIINYRALWDIDSNGNTDLSGVSPKTKTPSFTKLRLGLLVGAGGATTFRESRIKSIMVWDSIVDDAEKLADIKTYLLGRW